ncbi:hypothetical protein [Dickeya chrysanthemi]|uniref:hypothetical protein n=1 Tax=Dickeya chrysanthemi TaxID=556 RepID=UPI00301639E7
MSDYSPLFQLRIEHEFFAGGSGLPFYGELSASSQQAAAHAGLLIKPLADGLLVLADRAQRAALQITDALMLRWWFGSREPDFFSYTALSGSMERETPYFHYTLSGAETGEVRLQAADNTAPEDGTPLPLNLRSRQKERAWLVDIDIRAAAITAFLNQRAAPLLIMPFRSQRRRWKYLFTAPYVNKHSRIQDSRQKNPFDYLGTEVLANGQHAQAFISREPLIIQKRSDYYFQLYQQDTLLIERLPVAMPRHQCRLDTHTLSESVFEIIVN